MATFTASDQGNALQKAWHTFWRFCVLFKACFDDGLLKTDIRFQGLEEFAKCICIFVLQKLKQNQV